MLLTQLGPVAAQRAGSAVRSDSLLLAWSSLPSDVVSLRTLSYSTSKLADRRLLATVRAVALDPTQPAVTRIAAINVMLGYAEPGLGVLNLIEEGDSAFSLPEIEMHATDPAQGRERLSRVEAQRALRYLAVELGGSDSSTKGFGKSMRWFINDLRRPPTQAVALAEERIARLVGRWSGTPSSDSMGLLVMESRDFLDARILRIIADLASDASKPSMARLAALNVMLGWLDPGKYYVYDFSAPPGERRLGHAVMMYLNDQEPAFPGPETLSRTAVRELLIWITAEIQRQGDPAMSRVAADIARDVREQDRQGTGGG